MRTACISLTALLCVAGVFSTGTELSFRTDMETNEIAFNPEGTSDISSVMLTDSIGIVCYNDWKNPEEGQCNAVDFSDPASPKSGPETVLTDTKSQRFTVSRFSDTMGVVCYSTLGTQAGFPTCNALTVSGTGDSVLVTKGPDHIFDYNSTFPYTMSVLGLSSTRGILCYQDTTDVYVNNRRDLVCLVLTVDGTSLVSPEFDYPIVNKTFINQWDIDNIEAISTTKLSDTVAVVCYADGTKQLIACRELTVSEDDTLAVGAVFWLTSSGEVPSSSPGSISLATLSDTWPPVDATRGVACFCNSQDGPTCMPLNFENGTLIEQAGDALTVGTEYCSDVSVTGMSETGAIVCYLSGPSKVGVCSGLVLNHGHLLEMGDPTEIPASGNSNNLFVEPPTCSTNPCDQWISVSRRDASNAVACYAGAGGSSIGRCRGLRIPEPTTTSSATSYTETSSTTDHTTTETSTSTATKTSTLSSTTSATSTSQTSTTETSSTTPHTTTGTETSVTTFTQEELSSGAPRAHAAGLAAAAIFSWALL